jgi:hypothetical protein
MYVKGYSRIDLIGRCLHAVYIDLKDLSTKKGGGTVVVRSCFEAVRLYSLGGRSLRTVETHGFRRLHGQSPGLNVALARYNTPLLRLRPVDAQRALYFRRPSEFRPLVGALSVAETVPKRSSNLSSALQSLTDASGSHVHSE